MCFNFEVTTSNTVCYSFYLGHIFKYNTCMFIIILDCPVLFLSIVMFCWCYNISWFFVFFFQNQSSRFFFFFFMKTWLQTTLCCMRCSCFRRCCRNLVMNFSENVFPKSLIFRCYCLSYTFCLLFCKFIKTLDISFEGLSHMVMWYGVLLIDKLKPYDDLNI